MYTILVNDDNQLVATNRERIMQRSKLVNKLHFLVNPTYNGYDMSSATVCLEYRTPVLHKYRTEILVLSDELYKERLEYVLPIDTELTQEPGDVELQLTFTFVDMDANGVTSQHVRKISGTTLTIIPISAWSDTIPDEALTALDQRLIKSDMLIAQLADINMALADSVPDDVVIKEGKLYLAQNGQVMPNTIGADVIVPRTQDDDAISGDGIIELGNINHDVTDPDCECGCDHSNYEELDSYIASPDSPDVGNFEEL